MSTRLIVGDVRKALATLEDNSVHSVVTSPPYWGLRDYGTEGQLGLESTPEQYVENMVAVFREVRRVLRNDGTLWLNLGDSYAGSMKGMGADGTAYGGPKQRTNNGSIGIGRPDWSQSNLKPKDLVGIPWRVAFALRTDGWYLRSEIIWAKPNPMPESVTDRPTRSHEYLFLLTKSKRYYYDHEAIKEPLAASSIQRINQPTFDQQKGGEKDYSNGTNPNRSARKALENFAASVRDDTGRDAEKRDARRTSPPPPPERGWLTESVMAGRNKRDVWNIATKPFKDAHFAVFPPALVEPCILAGTSEKGVCAECGAPWKRVVTRMPTGYDGSKYGERVVAATGGAITGGTAASTLGSSNGKLVAQYETAGWQSSCSHVGEPISATVMDIFGGSGTVGMVAKQHGRSSVLIELNTEYVPLIKERLASVKVPA